MKVSMYAMSVEVFSDVLHSLAGCLDRGLEFASQRDFDPTVLFAARLFPDMLPLSRQVQLACDFAKNASARLADATAPRIEDDEASLEDLKQRIHRTSDYLRSLDAARFEGSEVRTISVPLRDRSLTMQGLPFLQAWALPNFFFHCVTTYNILRHNGVPVGKRDFLGPI